MDTLSLKSWHLVTAVLIALSLSGCSAKGVIKDPAISGYPSSEIYADLSKSDDTGYRFVNFGFSGDRDTRRVNLSTMEYIGNTLEAKDLCARGFFGITTGECGKQHQFARSYTTPPYVMVTPILSIVAPLFGKGSTRFFPVLTNEEFDYEQYNKALASALSHNDFDERFQKITARLNSLQREQGVTEAKARERVRHLTNHFENKIDVDLSIVGVSGSPLPKWDYDLSDSVIHWQRKLSVSAEDINRDLFGSPGSSFASLDELEAMLDRTQAKLVERATAIESAHLTLTPELHWKAKRSLDGQLISIRLPDPVVWTGSEVDHPPVQATLTLKTKGEVRSEKLTAERKVKEKQASEINRLRSSIGRLYCSSGQLQYTGQVCGFRNNCYTRESKEPGQLQAFLEAVSDDGSRIKLRVHHWATSTGRLREAAVSSITFKYGESLSDLLLGASTTQRADPGLVFWSSPQRWFSCKG